MACEKPERGEDVCKAAVERMLWVVPSLQSQRTPAKRYLGAAACATPRAHRLAGTARRNRPRHTTPTATPSRCLTFHTMPAEIPRIVPMAISRSRLKRGCVNEPLGRKASAARMAVLEAAPLISGYDGMLRLVADHRGELVRGAAAWNWHTKHETNTP